MKSTTIKLKRFLRCRLIAGILVGVCGGGIAEAQSNTNTNFPAPADYGAFSRFIAQRNIFDPNRQPHYTSSRARTSRSRTSRPSSSAPAFTLVGTMAYEKGEFAFFSGNSDELKLILSASGQIAGYTVAAVATDRVVLESGDKKERIELKIGDVMRQENGKWEMSGPGELPAHPTLPSAPASGDSAATDAPATPVDTTPAGEPNDVLKRLMEKRAQENK